MLFWRVKPLDQILATAEKKALHRQLGPIQLTLLGVGAVIGTGIFVLTAEAAQKSGPAMMIAFVIAAVVCGLAALAYAELASMVPVSGSAYTYTYGVMGELIAWIVGWALVLEYAIGATAVCVGWSGYVNGLLNSGIFGLVEPGSLSLPTYLQTGYFSGGGFNLLAFLIGCAVTWLLVIGTSKSAKVNAVLVAIKIVALTAFIVLALPAVQSSNLHPFMPTGWGSPTGGVGILGAAASIFFAYVGFDAVSTAAEETKNPNRNIPIGLIGALAICTIFYLLVGYGAAGSVGAQPLFGANGMALDPGTPGNDRRLPPARQRRRAGVQQRAAGPRDPRARLPAGRQPDRAGRRARAAVGHPDDDVRPDPHLLHDVARRPAAGRPVEDPLALPHPARGDRHHRHRGGHLRGAVPGSASWPTPPTPAPCWRSRWCRSAC